jgi:hypothetical protein
MSDFIKKFGSVEEFNSYRSKDGWGYPSVNYIKNGEESSVHYNNELIMQWNENDTAKAPSFYGDVSHDDFKAWVDSAAKVCEIKKDGSDFAYLKMSGNSVADYTLRADGSASHYNTADKADYLQMTEIKNVNVGLFKDSVKGTKQVRFNFDAGCPKGFYKWFPNSTSGTKLFGRYDVAPITSTSAAGTEGINCCYGESQGAWTENNYEKGNWSSNTLLAGIKATNANLLEETYWEHLVMSYLFCAYYKTFDTQSVATGLQSGYNKNPGYAGQWTAGGTDGILTPHGKNPVVNDNNEAYKFMHLENPLHGKQWIWGAGWVGKSAEGKGEYWLTLDDIVANKTATLSKDDAQFYGTYLAGSTISGKYISKIDLFGVPTEANASSSTGFYDGFWAYNLYDSRVAYLGGGSYDGLFVGAFARGFDDVAPSAHWNRRGRITMNK